MIDDAQASTSIWMATASTPSQSRLRENIRTDVCIIGTGIAGLSTAYLLGRDGRSVVVLDDGLIGGGMTGRTTAHLSNAYDDRYVEIEKMHGEEAARLTAESHTAAIQKISEIVSSEKIDCDFEWLDGFLFASTPDEVDLLDDELAAAHRAGLTDVEKVARAPLASFDTGVALRFPRQAQFHPLNYMDGLAQAIKRDGGRLFGQTHATKIQGGSDAHVETNHGPRFPQMLEVQFRWSGQVMEPVDGLAFIGRNPLDDDNVYIATGDSGQGMTHGTIAGMLLTDLIQGRKNQWEDLYNPSRIRVKSLPEYASENINVARQYADYVTAGDITSESELKPGEGAIMRDGVSKVAVHRDHNGNVHKLSAVCPHLGCIVAWNSTEQTWDCPCHGSRFSAEGRVYQGPANSNLPSANES